MMRGVKFILNMAELNKWLEEFDKFKYPFGIYKDLVIHGEEHPRKIELMGAWKTGSLRFFDRGNEYKDSDGYSYNFTNRWQASAPVGFHVWRDISDNQEEVKNKIPVQFPLTKPQIVMELQVRKGFGFIWTLFTLHCFYPETYPLYDQHVYRAYKYCTSNDNYLPNMAPDDWNEYLNYRDFFIELQVQANIHYWELDKALWAYGKYLKQSPLIKERRENKHLFVKDIVDIGELDGWIHSVTFGGRAKKLLVEART